MSHQLRSYLHSIHLSAREQGSALPPGLAIGERIFRKRDLNPILASPSNLIGSGGAFVFAAGRMMSAVKEGKTIIGS